MSERNSCHHCEGLGYIEIRDCSGEIQREETCSFCGGGGYIQEEEEGQSSQLDWQGLPNLSLSFPNSNTVENI